jgi:hypothetical protein
MSESGIISPADLKKITDGMEMAKAKEALDRHRKQQEEENAFRQAFMERELRPDAIERFNTRVRRAAEQGQQDIEIARFPSEYCTDHGRAINNFEPGWPDTLTGVARRAYDAFKQHLEPQGYKMRAQILNYPDGNLGEVGLYISW